METDPCRDAYGLLDSVELYGSLFFALISTSLYCWLIHKIVRNKQFHHPFYYQFVFLALTNILLWCSVYFMHRLIPSPWICPSLFPRFLAPTYYFKPFVILYFMAIAAQLMVIMLICVHRMCSVVWPLRAEKFWTKRSNYLLLTIICFSILYGGLFFSIGTGIDFMGSRITIRFQINWPFINPSLTTAIFSLVCLVTICFSTVVTLIGLKRTKLQVKDAEINMFRTSVGFSVTTIFVLLFMILFYILHVLKLGGGSLLGIVFDFRGLVFDINCMMPAWLLYFTNRRIRKGASQMTNVSTIERPGTGSVTGSYSRGW